MKAQAGGRTGRSEILPFEVHQSFWGYVIRGTEGPPVMFQVTQGLVLSLGAGFMAASLTLATLSLDPGREVLSLMRLGAAALLMAVSALLLRYATRGGVVELHVDLARGELREVVRHRIGRTSTVGRHGFDPSASLHIHRNGPPDSPRMLVLHHRGSDEGLCVARGPEHALMALRMRLDHDMRTHGPAVGRALVT